MPIRGAFRLATGAGNFAETPALPTAPVIGSFTVADNPATEGVATTFNWTLSGGTPTSQVVDPADGSPAYTVSPGTTTVDHTFPLAGTYDPTLTVSNAGGSDSETITGVIVETPGAIAFKTYDPLTSFTKTFRNHSGASKDYAPVRFLATFNKAEIPSGSRLQLKDNGGSTVADTDWQYSQRTFFADGSLKSCIVYAYGPAGWTSGSDKTFTIERVTGSHPSETDSVDYTILSGVTNPEWQFDSITRLGPDATPTTQAAHTNASLTFNVTDALALARAQKLVAGPIVTCLYTWRKMRSTAPADDDYIWQEVWVEIWRAPSSSTVRHVSLDGILNNGWATKEGQCVAGKLKLMDGASTVIDYTHTQNLTSANINTTTNAINVSLGTTTMPVYAGTAVKVASGTPPAAFTVGKIYQGLFGTDTLNGTDPFANSVQTLATLGTWLSPGYSDITDTGGSWTLEVLVRSVHRKPVMLRDRDGFILWTVGGARILPAYTRAEKIRCFQTGELTNVDLDTGTTFSAWGDRPYHPSGNAYHRLSRDSAGGVQQGGHHIGELGTWGRDVLIDMTSFANWKTLFRAAAESPATLWCGLYEGTTDGGGVEYSTPIVLNNGADKAGAQYSGLGPCRPYAHVLSGHGTTKLPFAGNTTADGAKESGAIWSQCVGGSDGTHVSQAHARAFELDPCWSYRRLAELVFTEIAAATTGVYAGTITGTDVAKVSQRNKQLGSTIYYCVMATGIQFRLQKRTFIGATASLKILAYYGDSHPAAAYWQDLIKDNIEFLKAFWNDPARMGPIAKIIGSTYSLEGDPVRASYTNDWNGTAASGGSNQHWQMNRLATATLRLMKAAGIESTEVLQWCTAHARLMWGDPVSGNPPDLPLGNIFQSVSSFMYDNAQWSVAAATGSRQLLGKFLDDAVQHSDASWLATDTQYTLHELLTDGQTFRITMSSLGYVLADVCAPSNGDRINFATYGNWPALPTGVNQGQWYWVYDRSGTPGPGATVTYKLSSTDPAIATTPVTWTTATIYSITNQNLVQAIISTTGPYDGLWDHYRYNAAYVGNSIEPVTSALMMFGEECGALGANANILAFRAALLSGQSKDFAKHADTGESANITKYITS